MSIHTHESLSGLSFRNLQQVAKSFGLIAQGDRDNLTLRILEAQGSSEQVAESSVTSEDAGAPDRAEIEETVSTDAEPSEVTPSDSAALAEEPSAPEVSNLNVEAPAVALPQPSKREEAVPAKSTKDTSNHPISAAAKRYAAQMIAGYITRENYDKSVEKQVLDALAAGQQPCVIKGKSNAKFEVKIFDKAFSRADLSSDVIPTRDGVVLNVARRLADANLIPYTK
jgi:hypothetical protein